MSNGNGETVGIPAGLAISLVEARQLIEKMCVCGATEEDRSVAKAWIAKNQNACDYLVEAVKRGQYG